MKSVELQVWRRAGSIAAQLKDADVELVLYEASMSPILKQRLLEQDISVVENIGASELRTISVLLGCVPWDGAGRPARCCCARGRVEQVDLGNQVGVRIRTVEKPVFSLIVSAPNSQLAKQYTQAIFSLLKTCQLLWGDWVGTTQSSGEGERRVGAELSKLGAEHGCEVLKLLAESICSLQNHRVQELHQEYQKPHNQR